jgi:UDP-N-acetyl-D-galactosamine dehydrogenase
VLEAAGTKWNFLPFRPGLVGGHCIGVDPYYLTHKAEAIGYNPQIILAGRRQNDAMGVYVAKQLIKLFLFKNIQVEDSHVLILGLTFKENCPDLRNTRVIDVIKELQDSGINVDVYDPWVNASEAEQEYGIKLIEQPEHGSYDGIILAVAHDKFIQMGADGIKKLGAQKHVLYDLKYAISSDDSDLRL